MSKKKCQKFADKLHKGATRQRYPNSKHKSNQIYLGNSERPSKSKFGIQGVGGPPSATSQVMMGGEVLEACKNPQEKRHTSKLKV
jgi:hypothetical protein